MKKLFTFLLFASTLITINSQNITGVINIDKPFEIKLNSNITAGVTSDTIYDYLDRATSFPVYLLADGYLAGTNGTWSEMGMVMTRTLSANETMELNSVFFLVYAKEIMGGSAESLTVNVFDVNANLPTGSAKSSVSVSMDIIDTTSATIGFNSVAFSTPVSVNQDFAVSIDLTGVDDTIAMPTSDPVAGNGNGENRLFININGSYMAINSAIQGGFNADLCMGAIVTITSTTPPSGISNSEKELAYNTKVFPNPNNGEMTLISFASNQNNYIIKVYDLAGKEVYSEQVFEIGTLQHNLNLSDLNAGQYMLNITTENGASYSDRLFIK